MSGNTEKTKFSIRVDTELLELADAYILSLIHIFPLKNNFIFFKSG